MHVLMAASTQLHLYKPATAHLVPSPESMGLVSAVAITGHSYCTSLLSQPPLCLTVTSVPRWASTNAGWTPSGLCGSEDGRQWPPTSTIASKEQQDQTCLRWHLVAWEPPAELGAFQLLPVIDSSCHRDVVTPGWFHAHLLYVPALPREAWQVLGWGMDSIHTDSSN